MPRKESAMLTADFSTCVSELKKKALAFRKELASNNSMPVTIKVLLPSEDGSYPGQTLLELYNQEGWNDCLEYVYVQDVLTDIQNVGSLTGRTISAVDNANIPTEDMVSTILENAERYDWPDYDEFDAFEISEHSTGCLYGTICRYKYFKQDRHVERTPMESCIIIIG